MITLSNVILRRGPTILLKDVNWTIYHKQCIGLIGKNGSGKSSLFSLLLNGLQADAGELFIPKQLKLAHVAQETPAYEQSALEFVLAGDAELQTLHQELLDAEIDNNGELIAALHMRLGEIDAYTANARAAQLLTGLGFNQAEQQQPVKSFSGGWRMRLNLAHALMCRSDVLLLDEPTNHLDLDAVIWLAKWLSKYPGTLLLISHDREFLDEIVDHVAHIENQQLKLYTGNYSLFEKLRAEQLMLQQAAFEKQQKQIAHLQSFVNRFRAKASKARQAQSRLKAMERMEVLTAVQQDSPFQFHFKEPEKCPNPLLSLEDAGVSYGDKIVLKELNLQLSPKDRIALLGPNGAGKSSLIKLLAGEKETFCGTRIIYPGIKIGYFAQHQVDHLDLSETPLHHLKKISPKSKEQELRTYLGGFDFSGERVAQTIKNFSGGEKSRLALALIIWQKPNLLLLDEPTNHLDLEMRNALSIALQEYSGAIILVSHDRFLVRTTVDQLMLVANNQLTPFEGDMNEYQQWLLDFRKQKTEGAQKPVLSKKDQKQEEAKHRALRQPLLNKIKELEQALSKLEKQLSSNELLLSNNDLYHESNKNQLQEYLLEQADIKKKLTATETDWLNACEALESFDHGR